MSASALSAIKDLLDADTYLASVRATNLDATTYLQQAPDTTDLTTGIVLVLDHRGESWDRLTESRQKTLTFGILIFGNSLQNLDSRIVPFVIDLIDDAELAIQIDNHDTYNLEILSVREGLEEYRDKNNNFVYMADIECQLQYQTTRKSSANAFAE